MKNYPIHIIISHILKKKIKQTRDVIVIVILDYL